LAGGREGGGGQTRVPADRVQQAAHRVGPAIPDDSPRIPPV